MYRFFRRPDWSPCGTFFIVPSAQYVSRDGPKNKEGKQVPIPCAAVFTRGNMNQPCLYLPVHKKACVLVRFCPILFKRSTEKTIFNLNYEVVWAMATRNMVFVYSSRSTRPLYVLTNLHYATISDLAWDAERSLAVSSMDGYISFALFEEGELGERLPKEGKALHISSMLIRFRIP